VPTFAQSLAAGGQIVGRDRPGEAVEIVEYDSVWPARFEEMRSRLSEALGEAAVRIDHVGSTAVPGLAAKPVVDIQVSVVDVEDDDAYRDAIESCGFELRWIESGHRYFRPPPGQPRLTQVHVCTVGSSWERVHLLFRDYLRAHPQVAAEYAALKVRLAAKHGENRIEYNDDKAGFIDAVVAAAEDWARLTNWSP
jgi:GrpB-like predicted nucleotidyltransferase (UPF0157 family)